MKIETLLERLGKDRMFMLIKEPNDGKARERVMDYLMASYHISVETAEKVMRRLRIR